jgi:hypothetical protein
MAENHYVIQSMTELNNATSFASLDSLLLSCGQMAAPTKRFSSPYSEHVSNAFDGSELNCLEALCSSQYSFYA